MKIILGLLITIAVSTTSELTECYLDLNIYFAILLAIPIYLIGVIAGNLKSKKDFDKKVSEFILTIVEIRKKNKLKSKAVQDIMCQITKEFSHVFDQKIANKEKNLKELQLSCLVCDSDHITDDSMDCTNCGISSDKWTYLNDKLRMLTETQ